MSQLLLIDDDESLRRALRIALTKAGHTVTEAGNGREGLKAFAVHPFDLVVTDVIMPDVEGVETIREIRKLNPRIPIIAISGGSRVTPGTYLQIAKMIGANEVMLKPLEIADLLATVTRLMATPGPAIAAAETTDSP